MFGIQDPKSATTVRSTSSLQRLHHVGFVVTSIDERIGGFVKSLAATWDGKIIHDRLQRAKVTFLRTPGTGDALVELVEPAGEDSPVSRFTKKGGGLHHLCYEVGDLAEHLKFVKAARCIVVRAPQPAVAFEQRLIAWALTPERLLLEFLEAPENTSDLPFVELIGDKSS
jgi:methylmalonyl-CoA/ethylmalonyl-CoA epimerase